MIIEQREAAPIGLGVVGAGYWGPNLVRTALATPASTLIALASELQLVLMCDHTYCSTAGWCSPTRSVDRGGTRIPVSTEAGR